MARYWKETNYPQPTEEELKENAKNTRKNAAAKGKTLHPVIVKSRQIANSWWGKAWCQNLERYADFDTRLPRGRRYVRFTNQERQDHGSCSGYQKNAV